MKARDFLDLRGIPLGEPALVGVSGGRDSVALLHLLLEAGLEKLVVCHLDHSLRPESGEDAAFVRSLAETKGCPVVVGKDDVRALSATEKLSLEAAARKARQRFYAQCAEEHGTQRVFLGHHARDQAETVLINLIRGSGAAGLSGMARVSRMEIDGHSMELLRPFLHRQPEEIFARPEIRDLPFREDASNASPDFLRNRIRHDALSVLEQAADRDIVPAINRTADLLREEDDLLRSLAAETLSQCRTDTGNLKVALLRMLPVALQRRVLQTWLRDQNVSGISFDVVDSVRALLEPGSQTVARANLASGRFARRKEGVLFVE